MRIAIVEDTKIYRESLETVVRHALGCEQVSTFGRAELILDELERSPKVPFDLILMDIGLPGISGIEATRRIKRAFSEIKVIMLTVFEEPNTILEAVCAGADGYMLKKETAQSIAQRIRNVGSGHAPLSGGVAKSLLEILRTERIASTEKAAGPDDTLLSPRERDVLRGLVNGGSYAGIADDLGISIDTVRTHIRNIYKKLQVHSVAEAVTKAIRNRLT